MASILGSAAIMASVSLGLKTSESVWTSPVIELTPELEGEQDLVLGGRGGDVSSTGAIMASLEQFWDEGPGGSTLEPRHRLVLLDLIASLPSLGLKTSESVKTSPCIELTSEQEGELDLVLRGKGGACNNQHLLGDALGVDVRLI